MTKRPPMTETEQIIVATQLAAIERILTGHVPDHVIKTLEQFKTKMNLPTPSHKWWHIDPWTGYLDSKWDPTRETPRASERLSEDEINIVLEWLDAIVPIYNGRVSAPALDASLKLHNQLWELIHLPIAMASKWRAFDKSQRAEAKTLRSEKLET